MTIRTKMRDMLSPLTPNTSPLSFIIINQWSRFESEYGREGVKYPSRLEFIWESISAPYIVSYILF